MILKGQVALINGGGRGLGRATALALAKEGAHVIASDILAEGAIETANEVTALGVKGLGVTCDASDEGQVEAMIERIVVEFGQLDILVNTVAWIEPPALIKDTPLEIWEKTLKYDLTTHFIACKAALKHMIARNYGRIVNVSSDAGKVSHRLRGSYGAAKAGVNSLSQTLAVETAEYNIKVNALCPRGITGVRLDTIREMMAQSRGKDGTPRFAPSSRNNMDPSEVAEFILYLSSPGTKINAQAITMG